MDPQTTIATYQAATFWVIFLGFAVTIGTVIFKAGQIKAEQANLSGDLAEVKSKLNARDQVIETLVGDIQYVIGHLGLERRGTNRHGK